VKLPILHDHRVIVPCTACAFRAECGGLDDQQSLWGCFSACSVDCVARGCDWTCPASPADFIERMRDVGGFSNEGITLKPLGDAALPSYVPMIHHGYGRGGDNDVAVDAKIAAISIKDVFRARYDGRLEVVADDAVSLRRRFGLRDDSKVMLVCIANDRPLERYWAHRRLDDIPARLTRLGLLGVTLPNYSFFTDAPRTHTLWNRRRMLRVGEELSAQGLPVVPHLNALTNEDWRFWRDFLRSHPEINVLAKEFQTGLREKDKAANAIASLRKLQDDVGRPLRLVAVGATRYLRSIRNAFASVTFVDSGPFMRAMKRRARVPGTGKPQWRKVSVPSGRELLDLLNSNIRSQTAFIARNVGA
jgi:Domain of unknown function (DUF4417)